MTNFLIETDEQVERALEVLASKSLVGVDTETTGLNSHKDKLVSIQFSDGIDGWFFPVAFESGENVSSEAVGMIKNFLNKFQGAFAAYNANYDVHIIQSNWGVKIRVVHDPMIMMRLLGYASAGLKFAAREVLGEQNVVELKSFFAPDEEIAVAKMSPKLLLKYGCDDAIWTVRLIKPLHESIDKQGLSAIYDLEIKFQRVLRDMEYRGMKVDVSILISKSAEFLQNLEKAKDDFWGMVDARMESNFERVSLNSSKKVSALLYDTLGYVCQTYTTKTKARSSSLEALSLLEQDDLISKLIEIKSLENIFSHYLIRAGAYVQEGRIRPDHSQIGESGRPYTRNPNIQQWPNVCREAIFPDGNSYFILADYKAAELRLLTAMTGEPFFQKIFKDGVDPHISTMVAMTSLNREDIDKKQRTMGKILNYGIIYGMEKYGLARRLLVNPDTAEKLLEKFNSVIPKVVEWKRKVEDELEATQRTTTLWGRSRTIPEIRSKHQPERDKAKRQAVNHRCQGGIADLMKIVSVELSQAFGNEWVEEASMRIVEEVHDSILFQIGGDISPEEALETIRPIMEIELSGVKMECNFVVGEVGQSWGSLSRSDE
jgi:DNA polymerase-1